MRGIKTTMVLVVLLSMLFLMSFCGSGSGDEIRIGAIFATSGPASALGMPEKNTVLMLQEAINAQGGINGKDVKIIFYDTKTDPEVAKSNVEKLLQQDEVVAIIGPTTSGVSMKLIEFANENEIALVSCAGSSKIVNPVTKWVFKTPQSDTHAVQKIIPHLQKSGITKVALCTATSGWGQSGKEQLEKLLPEAGLNIVASETFDESGTNISTQLLNIKQSGAEAIIGWAIDPGSALICRDAKKMGLTLPIYLSHGAVNDNFLELAKDSADGVFLPAGKLPVVDVLPAKDPQKKVIQEYVKAYAKEYNGEMTNTFGGHAYDAFYIVKRAIENANSTDRAKIRDAIENIEGFVGIGGVFNYSGNDHNGLDKDAFVLLSVKNGKWVFVE